MLFRSIILCLWLSSIALSLFGQNSTTASSPDGKVSVNFNLTALGEPYYQVLANKEVIIDYSRMGLMIKDGNLSENLKVDHTTTKTVKENWNPVWGESSTILNEYNELVVNLKEAKGKARSFAIIFRVFNDGVAFRYSFPLQASMHHFIVEEELSEFALTGDHLSYWIPGDYNTNEYRYNTSKLSEIDGLVGGSVNEIHAYRRIAKNAVQTPLTMKTSSGKYIALFEAALINYPALNLMIDQAKFRLKAHLVPDPIGNKAYLTSPCTTPWRTVIIGNKATDLLDSKMVLNLNEPCKIKNTSWIKPMKYMGIWWEMHIGKSSWDYAGTQVGSSSWDYTGFETGQDLSGRKPTGKHAATTENTKKYIDFAAQHGFGGILVEGWNEGWEDWFGKYKEDVFDFVTPYPDFDVDALSKYSAAKKVKLIMHHETSASATNYERRMKDAYAFMKKYGYPTVKTGYVGHIIPRGEYHDGQWMVKHYERVAKETAKNELMLVSHESVRPTGLHRTYPNWMACESARGQEFNAWSAGNLPEHETILPFTRLLGGPMDYTPGIFSIKLNQFDLTKKEQVQTTLCKQLALYLTLYSPVQMAADLPENYAKKIDAFQFIKDVAVDWDQSKYIDAEIGDYIIVARKAKGTNNWFLGAITDENGRTKEVKLDFLDAGKKYLATIYRDADNAHWQDNPEAYVIEKIEVTDKSSLTVKMAAGGGYALSIMERK